MNRTFVIAAMTLLCISFASAQSQSAPGQPSNLAPSCVITASSISNPVWSAAKAADGSTGPTDGWLGEWGTSLSAGPWISFSLPSRSVFSSIELMQASLEQASKNRFSRPKKITVDFVDGTDTKKLSFTLRDAESEMQPLKFAPIAADTVVIHIDSVYPGTIAPASTGFQEIKLIGNPSEGRAAPYKSTDSDNVSSQPSSYESAPLAKDYKPSTIAEPIPGEGWRTESPGDYTSDEPKSGSLSADEKEILNLLRELIDRLEKKFLQD